MKTLCIISLLAATLAVSSCSRPAPETYKAPAEPTATAPAADPHAGMSGMPGMPGGMGAHPSLPAATTSDLAWTAPATWTLGAASPMRLATYELTDPAGKAAVSIVALAGDGGGELANVNRWRGQLELAPVTDADLKGIIQPLTLPAGAAKLVTIKGATATAPGMVIAILPVGGQSYFVKFIGPQPALDAHRAEYDAFLQSFHPAAPAAAVPATAAPAAAAPAPAATK